MTNEEIKQRARVALARALKVSPESIQDTTSQMDLANWDSVRHMNVVLALENEFNIEFDDNELAVITSLPRIVETIQRRTGS